MKGIFLSVEDISCEVLPGKYEKAAGGIAACRTYIREAYKTAQGIRFTWVVDSETGERASKVMRNIQAITSDVEAQINAFADEKSRRQ